MDRRLDSSDIRCAMELDQYDSAAQYHEILERQEQEDAERIASNRDKERDVK